MTDTNSLPQQRRRIARWGGRILLGALVLLGGLNLLWMGRNYQRLRPEHPSSTQDFVVRRIDAAAVPGSEFRLSAERGHPVLVDFWATWCAPCLESLPILDQVYARLHEKGLRAIAIETEGAEGKARAMVSRLGLQMPIGTDEGELSARFYVTAIPYMLLIDGEGNISRVFRGVHSASEIERAVVAAGLK